jgi:hypothetical protein
LRDHCIDEFSAKAIKNSVTQNKQRSVEELNLIISKLTAELSSLKLYVSAVESELAQLKGSDWDSLAFRKQVNSHLFIETLK